MTTAKIKVTLNQNVETVWNMVTSLTEWGWRSDVSRIEILESGRRFVEYTEDGYTTAFTITAFEPLHRYEFDMENGNMKGHWVGLFSGEGEKTTIDFTEDITVKKWFMKPFASAYLKKQQQTYANDLRKALETAER